MSAPISRIEDILTPEEKAALDVDLARIHKTMYPCWDRTETAAVSGKGGNDG